MKRYYVFVLLIAFVAVGCGPTQQTAAAETQIAEVWTPTPTDTAIPTSTPTPILTPTPTLTPLPTVTPRMPTPDLSLTSPPVEQLSFPFMAINQWDSPVPNTLLLYDLSTGGVRYIKFDDYYSEPVALGWAENGCQIIVSGSRQTDDDSWVYEIARTDLRGSERTPIYTFEEGTRIGEGEYELYKRLSPSADHLAYVVGSGECIGMAPVCESHRAYVISLQQNNSFPVELTSNASVMYLEWSPTGDRLAFTDNDENGQTGLYVIKPDNTEKIHIIDLTKPVIQYWTKWYGSPLWSPQGDAIAVVDWIEQGPEQYEYVIRILSSTGGELHQIPVEFPPLLVGWSENSREIVFRADSDLVDKDIQPQIFWLDIASGEVVHTLRKDDVEEEYYLGWVYSINYTEDLLLTAGSYGTSAYLYNRTAQSLIPVSSRPIYEGLPYNLLVSPPDFPGEENCPTTP